MYTQTLHTARWKPANFSRFPGGPKHELKYFHLTFLFAAMVELLCVLLLKLAHISQPAYSHWLGCIVGRQRRKNIKHVDIYDPISNHPDLLWGSKIIVLTHPPSLGHLGGNPRVCPQQYYLHSLRTELKIPYDRLHRCASGGRRHQRSRHLVPQHVSRTGEDIVRAAKLVWFTGLQHLQMYSLLVLLVARWAVTGND